MKFRLLSLLLTTGILLAEIGLATFVAAAPPPPPMVAIILPRDNARFQTIHENFLKNFQKVTTVAGKPRIYIQSPNPDSMSLRNSIRKATALGADLIVVYGTRAATAAKQEDFTEPLIFADVFDPVAMGLVPSLSRGGTLVTGVLGNAPTQTLFKALQETVGTSHLGIPVEPKNPAGKKQLEVLSKLACRRGGSTDDRSKLNSNGDFCWLEVIPTEMRSPADMPRAFKTVAGKIDAIYLGDLIPTDAHMDEIIAYAAQNDLPVISQVYGTAEKGAFMTLESDPVEQGELLADIAALMIEGDLPEDVPPMIPRRVSLTINLAVAKQLGIQVPFAVLSQTTRVIR